jgi:hypothetical protein
MGGYGFRDVRPHEGKPPPFLAGEPVAARGLVSPGPTGKTADAHENRIRFRMLTLGEVISIGHSFTPQAVSSKRDCLRQNIRI